MEGNPQRHLYLLNWLSWLYVLKMKELVIMPECEIIKFVCKMGGLTVHLRPLSIKASLSCLIKTFAREGKWVWLVWGYVWHQIRFGFYVKWSGWAWPAMGSIFGLQGLKKKTGSPWEPLQAISSSASSTPLGLCLYLAYVCVCVYVRTPLWLSACTCVCVCVCICILSLQPVPGCTIGGSWCYLMAVLWQPLLRIIKDSCLEIPEMPNRKHWWPGFTLCPTSPPPPMSCNVPDQLLLAACRLYNSWYYLLSVSNLH